jgi:hypothetical protein
MKEFYITEYKYLVNTKQIEILRSRMKGLFNLDEHCNNQYKYNVRSLYFDNYANKCFHENETGCDPRQKYRIRVYNNSLDLIRLEQKNKINNKVIKYKCNLSFEQAYELIKGKYKIDILEKQTLLRSFIVKMMNEQFRPVVIVSYDRYPYVYKNSDIRVTFDTSICFSNQIFDFFCNNFLKSPVYNVNIMEIKYSNYVPDFILKLLDIEHLQRISFSKYFISRKNSILY